MSEFGGHCEDCVRCSACDETAYCLSQPSSRPCPHDKTLCGDCLEACRECVEAMVELAFVRVTGRPLTGTTARLHPMQEEADNRRIERAQSDRWWAGHASPREMDGAAADHVYGREPDGDWRLVLPC